MVLNDERLLGKLQDEQRKIVDNKVVVSCNQLETCIKCVRECVSVINENKDLL